MKKLILFTFVLILLSSGVFAANSTLNNIQYDCADKNPLNAVRHFAVNETTGSWFRADSCGNQDGAVWNWNDNEVTINAKIGNGFYTPDHVEELNTTYSINTNQELTISTWFNSSDTAGNIFGQDPAGAGKVYYVGISGDNIRMQLGDGANEVVAVWLNAYKLMLDNASVLHNIVISIGDEWSKCLNFNLYIDGNFIAQNAPSCEEAVINTVSIGPLMFGGVNQTDVSTNILKGIYDEILIFETNLTNTSAWHLYLSDWGEAAPPSPVQPADEFINFTGLFPLNNTQYGFNTLNFNTSVNATNDFTARLYFNGTLNQTRTFSAGKGVFVSFNATLPDTDYNFQINASETSNATRNDTTAINTFYVDSTFPTFVTNFLNHSIFYRKNLTGSFNFSDNVVLFSFDVTVDGSIQVANRTDLNVSFYSYNLSYNISGLDIGHHNLTVRFADGHTANALGGDYDFSNGLFNDYSKYDFWDGGWIKTELKDKSVFDSWTSKKEIDKYTQEFIPNNPSSTVILVEESSSPIHIINKPGHYNGYWVITGNHWKDYVLENEPNAKISVNRINDYKVEITISGIKNTELLKFSSIGELNVVQHTFNFTVTTATTTFSSQVTELESQTISFAINVTGNISSTDAELFYDGSQKTVTKTPFNNYDLYSTTFITPEVNGSTNSENKSFYWSYQINGSGANESGSLNFSQTVFLIGLDNCSTFNMRALDITLRDETTNDLINGSIAGFFRTWVGSINNFTTHNLTWGHDTVNSPVGLCIFPNESTIYSYAQIEYSAPGYETKFYYFDNTTFDNSTETLNLFLTNGTTLVTFTVTDFNDLPIEDVIIKILSYDIATDTSTTTEILKTDTDGRALAQIILNTQFYRFILEYNGEVVLATEPTKITTIIKKFRINLISDYFNRFTQVRGIEHLLRFTNSTLLFDFIYSDPTGGIGQGCLKVIRKGLNADFLINDTCVTSTASTISTRINESVGTNTYEATSYVIFSDGEFFVLDKLSVSFDNKYKTYGISGIFVSFMIVLILVMIGIWSPAMSVAMMILGLFVSIVMGVFFINWEILVAFIILAGITMYKVSRN